MEKIKIKSCTLKKDGGTYKIYSCVAEDGRTGDTFKEYPPGEYDVEIKPNANPQYADSWKIIEKKFGQKDYGFEKKKAALEFAVRLACSNIIKSDQIEAARDKFYGYLNS